MRNNWRVVDVLLKHDVKCDVDCMTRYTYTALYLAVIKDWHDVVEKLLKFGANPNLKTNGETPLCAACECSMTSIVQLLLNHGADHTIVNEAGATPYDMSMLPEIREMLIKHGHVVPVRYDDDDY